AHSFGTWATFKLGNSFFLGQQIFRYGSTAAYNISSINAFILSANKLSGNLPPDIGLTLPNLQLFGLGDNNFSGHEKSPHLWATLPSTLILRRNMIKGSIPTALDNCTHLKILDLGYNRLTGPIPKQLIGLFSLTDGFRLGPNYLSWPLPPEVGNLKNLRQMNISRNKLFGEIPSTLGDCQLLEFLSIQNNLFEGTIPQSFKQLEGIQELDLSSNNLSGQIPGFLGKLTLLHSLNISHNMFESECILNYENNRLCGGIPALQLPACPKMVKNKEMRPIIHIIVPLVVVFLSGVLLLACLALICYRHEKSQLHAAHCDLKPSNVLLDNNLCAHVGDFGLAKFILTSASVSSHTHSSSTSIRGTIGYLAP
ncbi:hypothetical protein RJ639_024417, partial [Escallonia herrerae]